MKLSSLLFQANSIREVLKMSRPKVFITRQINKEAFSLLEERCEVTSWNKTSPIPRDELLRSVAGKDALFCLLSDQVDRELLNLGVDLKVVGTMSVGHDHLDLTELKKRKIRVGYTPDILTDATAELTVALLLCTSRRLLEASEQAKTGGWTSWSPFWMCGPGLKNATVGIVGFGRIGLEVAKRLKPFNPKRIIYQSRTVKTNEINAERVELDELLARSDFVIATCALTPETSRLFDEAAFKKMRRNAVFINTSRGGVVDQAALINALKNNVIRAAGLDVTTPEPLPLDSELFKLPNCVVLPHIGSASIETREEMGILTSRNIIAGLTGQEMPAELNF